MENASTISLERSVNVPPRPLESIAASADRVQKLAVLVGEFVDRFHGPAPQSVAKEAGVTVSYRDQIARLSAAIDELDSRVSALSDIG